MENTVTWLHEVVDQSNLKKRFEELSTNGYEVRFVLPHRTLAGGWLTFQVLAVKEDPIEKIKATALSMRKGDILLMDIVRGAMDPEQIDIVVKKLSKMASIGVIAYYRHAGRDVQFVALTNEKQRELTKELMEEKEMEDQ